MAKASGELEIERFVDDQQEKHDVHLKEFIFPGEMILIFIRSVKCLDLSLFHLF